MVGGEGSMEAVRRLFALLDERGVDYLLVGGIALLGYVEGRNTEDIDLIVAAPALERLPEIRLQSREGDFARGILDGLQIDFLLTSHPLFATVQERYATRQRFVEREVPSATVEGLLLLKLFALPSLYRQGNFARVALYEGDVATLLHDYRPPVEPILAELAGHVSATDLAAVRRIVREIEERIDRFDRR
jgi:hypothetical protein